MKRKEFLVVLLILIMLTLIVGCAPSVTPDEHDLVRYVATDGDNANDGSEASPWRAIQYALDNIPTSGTIWVKDGVYNESITFPSAKMIILQSVNGDSLTTIIGDNNLPTVTCGNSLEGTTLEGFTITRNSADNGRGIIIFGGYLNIDNCTISENSSTYGGGISNSGTLTITSSTISHNSADPRGGGIYNYNSGTLTITSSTISHNSAAHSAGGIHNSGTLTITSSNISHNSASYSGGIYLFGSGIPTIGGSGEEKNTICGNYKTGDEPSLDQQIGDDSGSLYDTYKNTNFISAYCTP